MSDQAITERQKPRRIRPIGKKATHITRDVYRLVKQTAGIDLMKFGKDVLPSDVCVVFVDSDFVDDPVYLYYMRIAEKRRLQTIIIITQPQYRHSIRIPCILLDMSDIERYDEQLDRLRAYLEEYRQEGNLRHHMAQEAEWYAMPDADAPHVETPHTKSSPQVAPEHDATQPQVADMPTPTAPLPRWPLYITLALFVLALALVVLILDLVQDDFEVSPTPAVIVLPTTTSAPITIVQPPPATAPPDTDGDGTSVIGLPVTAIPPTANVIPLATAFVTQTPAADLATTDPLATPVDIEALLQMTAPPANALWQPVELMVNTNPVVLVPAGCFIQGMTYEDITRWCIDNGLRECEGVSRFEDEQPPHQTCISSFLLDKYEVSIGRFNPEEAFSVRGNRPMVDVSWQQAFDFCQAQGGFLVTEAQWEYSARGVDNSVLTIGRFIDYRSLVANVRTTVPVNDSRSDVSWVGAFNLNGNIREWMTDAYDEGYYRNNPPLQDPTGPQSASPLRVVKGAAWSTNDPLEMRLSVRQSEFFENIAGDIGFRCAYAVQQADSSE